MGKLVMSLAAAIIVTLIVIGAVAGTVIHVVERRADRALRREELVVENKKAEAALRRAENDSYKLVTERSRMELDFSRQPDLTSTTLDAAHRRDAKTELAAEGTARI